MTVLTRLGLGLLAASIYAAGLQSPQARAAIAGRVVDADSGKPLADERVGSREIGWYATNADGRFIIPGLEPGRHRIGVLGRYTGSLDVLPVTVDVAPGRTPAEIELRVRLRGTIAGQVLDDRGEPVPHARVLAIYREYGFPVQVGEEPLFSSAVLNHIAVVRTADSQGRFRIEELRAGIAYRVLAYVPRFYPTPVSDAPIEPSRRGTSLVATYHPSARTLDVAAPVPVRSLETATVDIRMRREAATCLEATLMARTGPGVLEFAIEEEESAKFHPMNVGTAFRRVSGTAGSDGRIRLCDLYAGRFRLTAAASIGRSLAEAAELDRTVLPIEFRDADVRGVTVTPRPPVTIEAEVVFTGPSPARPRPPYRISTWPWSAVSQPARGIERFTFRAARSLSYTVFLSGLISPDYVSDVTYDSGGGPSSVLVRALEPGDAAAGRLRVVVATDGGAVAAEVRDAAGAPVDGAVILVWPVAAATEGAVAAGLVVAVTNVAGRAHTVAMRPGSYYVLATTEPPPMWVQVSDGAPVLIKVPETMALLLAARPRAQQIAVGARGTADVRLMPTPIR